MGKRKRSLICVLGIVLTVFLALPMVAEASDVKLNSKNFPDSNFRKALKEAYPDLLNDGVVSVRDVEKILQLDVRGKDIKSVEGIQYFTKVTRFYCGKNPISELSALPDSIEKLDCSNCKLTEIKEFPENLLYLNCSNNKIESLPKITKKMVELNVSNNKLKKINGSFQGLYNLFASDNRLEGTFDARSGEHILSMVLSNNRLTRVVIPEGHAYNNLAVEENFLYSKKYIVNLDDRTARLQFSPQRKEHDFEGYKRESKATMSSSGWKSAQCSDCTMKKKLEIPQIKTVNLSYSKVVYDGKKKAPSVVVKDVYGQTLEKGTDYTISYGSSKRTAVGRYSVKVTFKGNYKGTKTLWFTVVPKAPTTFSGKHVSIDGKDAVKLTWKKVSNADGYYIHVKEGSDSYKLEKTIPSKNSVSTTIKSLKDGKKYTFKITPYYESDGGTKYKSTSYKTIIKNT